MVHLETCFTLFIWPTEEAADQSLAPSALKYRLIFLCQGENGSEFVIVCAPRQQPELNKANVMERIQMPHSDTAVLYSKAAHRSVEFVSLI